MGTNPNHPNAASQSSNNGVGRWLLPAIIAVGAAGMGITGTLLWMENQPKSTSKTETSQATSSPQMPMPMGTSPVNGGGAMTNMPNATAPNSAPGADSDSQHQPPASLTTGMPPVEVAVTLGNWYYDHEAWPNAVEQYQKALGMGLDNPDIRTDYGSALRFSGQPQKAIEQYRLAQKQDPKHENSLFNQGGVYASDLKDPAKAIAAWQQYIKQFPTGKSVNQAKLLIEREQGKLKTG